MIKEVSWNHLKPEQWKFGQIFGLILNRDKTVILKVNNQVDNMWVKDNGSLLGITLNNNVTKMIEIDYSSKPKDMENCLKKVEDEGFIHYRENKYN